MLDIFESTAVQFMREHYGKNFIINYCKSNDEVICFEQVDQTGKRFLRKYLPIPDWVNDSVVCDVEKKTGVETVVTPSFPIIQDTKN